ncbi:reverse transcriptase [Gossypium australe]|uniref:Reverse transcriptase n=1 Tax=Gossypium australe TaxID=47621 RepID=A0A5B6WEF7_9ROSI|nr:reverse transcriptase [Gossypium australe]
MLCFGWVLRMEIILERGLRQGDLISHYLFLFCMEVFSCLLCDAQACKNIRGVRVNDALLFVKNKKKEIDVVVNILRQSE